MSRKSNKIKVCVAPDGGVRKKMLAKLAVEHGFARIPSDAMKIIGEDIYSYNLHGAYFILCDNFSFRASYSMTQMLYELAARGIFVALGVKKVPQQYSFLCEEFYPEEF